MNRGDRLDLVVRAGTVVTSEGRQTADIGVRGGRVAQIGGALVGDREIDARGMLVLPGGLDPHVHLHVDDLDPGEPGWADDYSSGSEAAVAGGITTLGSMAYVLPWETIATRLKRESSLVREQAIADVFFHAVVISPTRDLIDEVASLPALGQTSIKVFMNMAVFEANAHLFTLLIHAAAQAGAITLVHCEDLATLECCATMMARDGRTTLRHYAESRPIAAESIATERAVAMCRATRAPMYVVHLSSSRALEICEQARAEGLPLYVETRPLYLHMTRDRYDGDDAALYVAQPPLREPADREAIWAGLARRAVDTIGSDHAPWTRELKADPRLDVAHARPGVAELDTMLPLLFTEAVVRRGMSVEQFVSLTSTNAAKLFGLYPRKGTIAVGSDADLVIWDTNVRRAIRGDALFSRAAHTVYEGMELLAAPRTTVRRGEVVFDEGRITAPRGTGLPLARGPSAALASARLDRSPR